MWQEYNTIGLWHRTKNSIVYWDTSVPSTTVPPPNVWQFVDLAVLDEPMPENVGHVLIRCWTPIQRPSNAPNGNAVLTVAFRAPGDTSMVPAAYAFEAMNSINGMGVRTLAHCWVPVVDRKFEYAWTRSTGQLYPPGCSYGINLELLGYARNA